MAQELSHRFDQLNQPGLDPVRNQGCADVAVQIGLPMNAAVRQNGDAV